MDRAGLRSRYERASEVPLLVLAVVMVPLLVLPEVVDLDRAAGAAVVAADGVIWGVFAADYLARVVFAERRWRHVRRNWVGLLIVVLPVLRPLRLLRSARVLRALRLVRAASFAAEAVHQIRRLLRRHQLDTTLLAVLVVVVTAAALVTAAERGSPGAIDSFADGLWWAVTTVTTVGYGDTFPVTAAGRGVGVFLMLVGIAFFGVVTANLAAWLVHNDVRDESTLPATREQVDALLDRIDRLEHSLAQRDTDR